MGLNFASNYVFNHIVDAISTSTADLSGGVAFNGSIANADHTSTGTTVSAPDDDGHVSKLFTSDGDGANAEATERGPSVLSMCR